MSQQQQQHQQSPFYSPLDSVLLRALSAGPLDFKALAAQHPWLTLQSLRQHIETLLDQQLIAVDETGCFSVVTTTEVK
jgi:hypothetical protein